MTEKTLKKISLSRANTLTLPQKKFIAKVVEGNNPTQAAKIAYPFQSYGSQRQAAVQNMRKPKIKNAIERALTKSNLTEQRITDLISDAMETKTPHTIDWNTKHNYIKTALQLKGYLNNKDSKNNTQVNVQLNLE